MTEQRLSECLNGESGIISRVDGQCRTTTRLRELGVIPGERIQVFRSGNPFIFQVGDTRLCVRREQLDCVSIISNSEVEIDTAEKTALV